MKTLFERMLEAQSQTAPDIAKIAGVHPRQLNRERFPELRCNCDLDNWEPEPSTGHSWVCRIHKAAIRNHLKGSQ